MVDKLDMILLAAGSGSRTIAPVAKQFLELDGKPVIIHSLEHFEQLPFIGEKIVTAAAERISFVESLLRRYGITRFQVIRGGDTRQESVRLALEHVRTPRVITHNAALPFVSPEEITNVAKENDPCVTTVMPMQYSLCHGGEYATEMVSIDDLKLINTPQSFDTAMFREAHRRAFAEKLAVRTDCELMMRYGHAVRFVLGHPCNFKITTHLDVLLAHALIQHRKQASSDSSLD